MTPLGVAEIEAALNRVAFEIERPGVDGPSLYPIFERLERELVAAQSREAQNHNTANAVRQRLASLPSYRASQWQDQREEQSLAIPYAGSLDRHHFHTLHG